MSDAIREVDPALPGRTVLAVRIEALSFVDITEEIYPSLLDGRELGRLAGDRKDAAGDDVPAGEDEGPGVGGHSGALRGGKENFSSVGYRTAGAVGRGGSSSGEEGVEAAMKRLRSGVDRFAARVGLKDLLSVGA